MIHAEKEFVSMSEAGEMLVVSRGRVWQLINAGKLRAQKVGTTWIIDTSSVLERIKMLKGEK